MTWIFHSNGAFRGTRRKGSAGPSNVCMPATHSPAAVSYAYWNSLPSSAGPFLDQVLPPSVETKICAAGTAGSDTVAHWETWVKRTTASPRARMPWARTSSRSAAACAAEAAPARTRNAATAYRLREIDKAIAFALELRQQDGQRRDSGGFVMAEDGHAVLQ